VAGLLGGYRVLIEHNYTATMDRSISTIINTTRDHHLGHWGRLFLAPRNIGYHIVHHIHPQVALENLPALRQWYIDNHSAIYPSAKHKAVNVN
jgi:fatty acid desaturase